MIERMNKEERDLILSMLKDKLNGLDPERGGEIFLNAMDLKIIKEQLNK